MGYRTWSHTTPTWPRPPHPSHNTQPIQKIVFWEDLRIARKIYQKRAVLTVMSANEKKTPSVIVSGNVAVENEEENYKSWIVVER